MVAKALISGFGIQDAERVADALISGFGFQDAERVDT